MGLVTGSVSVKIAQQYAPLRLDLGRARRIVVARAVEVDVFSASVLSSGRSHDKVASLNRKLHVAVPATSPLCQCE